MKLRSIPILISFILGNFFLFCSVSHAQNNVIVLLHKTDVPTPFKILNQDHPKVRYKKTMDYLKHVQNGALQNFAQDLKQKFNFVSKKVDLLPLIHGVALNLSPSEQQILKADARVYKILPNSPVYLDKPVSRSNAMTWGGGSGGSGGAGRTQAPTSEYNQSLLLHKVDQLIKDGVDINKPGKTVGVVDTGVDGKHPALANKVVAFKNIATGSTDPADTDTHGTHVSGIIAGSFINGLQIGVYPGAKLVVAAALSGIDNMVKGLQWIMDPDANPNTQDQPFVVNNSWHIGSADPEPFYRVIETFKDADILLAFSAGNAGTSGITKPKEHPLTFTSAAVDAEGNIADFSSWGPAIFRGKESIKPEVATMGVQVFSTLPGGKYGKMSGTSMASPFTTGVIGLLGAHFPNKSPYLIAEILRQSTAEQQTARPWHRQMGFGLMDVYAAYLKLKTVKANVLNQDGFRTYNPIVSRPRSRF